jgi:hypothetical protein
MGDVTFDGVGLGVEGETYMKFFLFKSATVSECIT